MAIDDLINKQPLNVRIISYVEDNRIYIPSNLRVKDIVDEVPDELVKGEISDEEALILSARFGKKELIPLGKLISNFGR